MFHMQPVREHAHAYSAKERACALKMRVICLKLKRLSAYMNHFQESYLQMAAWTHHFEINFWQEKIKITLRPNEKVGDFFATFDQAEVES